MAHGITIKNGDGRVKTEKWDDSQVVLVFEDYYEPGDQIIVSVPEVPAYYVIRLDDCMDEALVYLTERVITYHIPFEEKKVSYNPKAFSGECHYLTVRGAADWEVSAYRNLAKNALDQHGAQGCYPHAFANVETRGESVFAARNAIDGMLSNESHGAWPYESWGINQQDDAEITIDFGRTVNLDRIILYTRADFPHDNWWTQATLSFSDGTQELVEMEKRVKPHEFLIKKEHITWVKMHTMKKADDPSPFPALTQIEVYGK
ncbi:MAG: discoidin domain-containing protein [Lachnospiraceae bacterium]